MAATTSIRSGGGGAGTLRDSTNPRRAGVAFLIAMGIVSTYALPGGSYDVVVRQQQGVAIWWVLALGAALTLLPIARPRPVGAIPAAGLLGLAVWTAASLAWTDSAERTFAEVARVAHLLGLLLLVLCLADRRTWRSALAGASAGALAVCVLAVTSRLLGGWSSEALTDALGARRLSYPFNYWNALGAWASMAFLLGVGWSAHARHPAARAAFLAAIPWASAAGYLAYSRAAIAGVVVGVIVLMALSRYRWTTATHLVVAAAGSCAAIVAVRAVPAIANGSGTVGAGRVAIALVVASAVSATAAFATVRLDRVRLGRTAARRTVFAAVSVAAVVAVVAVATVGPDAWDQFRSAGSSPAATDPAARLANLNGTRYLVWDSAIQAFASDPLRGTGAGTFELWWNQDARGSEFVRDAHSLYLESLAELGVPGLVFVLVFVAGTLAALLSARRSLRHRSRSARGVLGAATAAFTSFLVSAGVDWMWESTAVAALALVVAGCGIASASTAPMRIPRALRAVAAISALGLLLVQMPGLASTTQIRRSQDAVAHGDLPTALADADDAVVEQPWAATPYVQRALVLETARELRAARRSLADAAKRGPRDWQIALLTARIEAELGRPARAIAAYRRARLLRPLSPVFAVRSSSREP